MRTTIILEDDVYRRLVNETISRYGSAKKMSKLLNELLSKHLTAGTEVPKSLFGSMKRMSLKDTREEGERI